MFEFSASEENDFGSPINSLIHSPILSKNEKRMIVLDSDQERSVPKKVRLFG